MDTYNLIYELYGIRGGTNNVSIIIIFFFREYTVWKRIIALFILNATLCVITSDML